MTEWLYVMGVFIMGCGCGFVVAAIFGLADHNERILRRRRRWDRRMARRLRAVRRYR